MSKPGLTPLGEALIRIEAVLDMATQEDSLLDILSKIRETDKENKAIKFVYGYAGGLKAVRVK